MQCVSIPIRSDSNTEGEQCFTFEVTARGSTSRLTVSPSEAEICITDLSCKCNKYLTLSILYLLPRLHMCISAKARAFRATIGRERSPFFGILWYKLLAESVALGRIHKLTAQRVYPLATLFTVRRWFWSYVRTCNGSAEMALVHRQAVKRSRSSPLLPYEPPP